ncbi:FAD-dependent oxidoreductase [Dermacoccus sp. Tok2021]|uniref:FAD-dependent oxidoreductase n=1 Tax=Dermacoccus sp. Tok2021 TaxID=2826873 RepID=UPI001CA67C83|nr:FAD-dependent oxidoreductase [Dermacoccus sp. Tok2021]MBZ4497365.1 FAD-dependent oxidoreductase [Dermacoccus sp. Tok2021]
MSATIEAFTAGLRRVPPWRPGRDAAAERHESDGRGGPAASRVPDAAAPHVVVVGGGIAGISAAVGLAERGVRVTLLEAESSLGGRVRSWPIDVPTPGADASGAPDDRATMSRGFHAFFRQYYNLRALLRRVDPSLECLRPVADYPLRHADGTQDSFTQIATRPPLNFLSFVARSPSFGLRDLTRVDAHRALDLLDVDFPATYSRYDGVSAADALDALRFPERMRSLALEVFARSFFAEPRDFSAGELVAMFHMYFLGSGEGLLFDVSRDDFDTTMWRPLRSYLEGLGAEVVSGCRVESIERDGEGFRVSAGAAAGAAGTDEASLGRLDFAIDRDDAHGSLRADAVVIATSRDVLQRLVDGTDLGDEAWRASVLTGEMAPRFIVQRLWFDRPVAAGSASFVGTAAYGHLDNVSLVHDLEDGAAQWAKRCGGSVVELHAYAVPDDVTDDEVLADLRHQLDRLHPELTGCEPVHEEVLVEADCPLAGTDEWAARPGVVTPQPKLVLAGDGVRCELPVALMERAATTGFQAANALLRHWGLPGHELWSVPTRARFPRSLRAARAALRLRERGLATVGRDSSGRGR